MTAPEKLQYYYNLLGPDLRVANFGGGNTSSKFRQKNRWRRNDRCHVG